MSRNYYRNQVHRRGYQTPSYNPMMFVKKAAPESQPDQSEYNPKHKFCDFSLDSRLVRNISQKGYKEPTPIQDQTIPVLLEGRDVVATAATGTGKTAAFLVPLINKVLKSPREKVLIITPTRELAAQVRAELIDFSQGTGLRSAICIGGVSLKGQIDALRRRPNFVVGTPGRLMDLNKQRKLNFYDYNNIVLDEVDRMLDMGFIQDIKKIIEKLPYQRQSLFFSATLSQRAGAIANQFLNNPVSISVQAQSPSENVDQDIVRVNGRNKIGILLDLLRKDELQKVLVFGRTKHGIERLKRDLCQKGVNVATIHGNKSQGQRKRALLEFRQDQVQVLLATDVASRGLDIEDITHVINYDLPQTYEDYIHRIGRTGRANKKGFALTFVD